MKKTIVILAVAGAMIGTAAAQSGTPSQAIPGSSSSTNSTADKSAAQAPATAPSPQETQRSGEDKGQAGERNTAKPSTRDEANQATAAMSVPGGSTVEAVLTKSLDSRKVQAGQEVTAKTTADLSAGSVSVPKRAKLVGHVTEAKARANGDAESSLGIVFDKAVLKNGQEVPLRAVVQAVAAPARFVPAGGNVDAAAGAPMPGGVPPSGGTMGGPPGGTGGTAGTAGAGGYPSSAPASSAGAPIGSPTGAPAPAPGSAGAATGSLDSRSQGVAGLPGYKLKPAADPAQGAVISSGAKNVKLDSGSQMVLRVITQ